MGFASAFSASFDTNTNILHMSVFLTLNTTDWDTNVFVNVYQMVSNSDATGEETVGCFGA
jgi:hypothetical protein